MIYLLIGLSLVISAFFSYLLIPHIGVIARRKKLFDLPPGATFARNASPRLGGVVFVPVVFFSLAFAVGVWYTYGTYIPQPLVYTFVPEFCLFVCGLTLLYICGIKEDLIGTRPGSKLLVQLLAASFLPLAGLWINNLYGLCGIDRIPAWAGIPLTLFAVVFITGALELTDTSGGIAPGAGSAALAVSGCLFLHGRLFIYALLSFVSLGALLPLFYYTISGKGALREKTGMGSAGRLSLGYILSFLFVRYAVCQPEISACAGGSIVTLAAWMVPAAVCCLPAGKKAPRPYKKTKKE